MSTKNTNKGIVLDGPDALEDLLNVNGDPGPELMLPPHVATFLGEQLQAYSAKLVSAPVPERFVQLLAQLDSKGDDHDGE